jgi:hypothetical protein
MKPGFSRRAQIASNASDFVWRKYSIDALAVQTPAFSGRMSMRVQDFETIIGRRLATRRSPCGQNGAANAPDFRNGGPFAAPRGCTLVFA